MKPMLPSPVTFADPSKRVRELGGGDSRHRGAAVRPVPRGSTHLKSGPDVMSISSSAANWSINYMCYLGSFNMNDRMFRIFVPVVTFFSEIVHCCQFVELNFGKKLAKSRPMWPRDYSWQQPWPWQNEIKKNLDCQVQVCIYAKKIFTFFKPWVCWLSLKRSTFYRKWPIPFDG